MIPFEILHPESSKDAASRIDHEATMALAGGTTMVDLMKLNVLKPKELVHVQPLLDDRIRREGNELVVGAACTMSELADDPLVMEQMPAVRQSLILAASPQIRNMATIGGNLLQRTRCTYYRHLDMSLEYPDPEGFGQNIETSHLAVLGNRGRYAALYPGDFAVTVVAFDGKLDLISKQGNRTVPAREFYRLADGDFQYSTDLRSGELIGGIRLPLAETMANSLYLKIRERSSYAFALSSASIGLGLHSGTVSAANVGLGGLGAIPWHAHQAEQVLIGSSPTDDTFERAAEAALAEADPPAGLEFKVPLAKRTIVRALQLLRDQGPLSDQQLWAMQHGRE